MQLPHLNRRELFYIPGEHVPLRRTRHTTSLEATSKSTEDRPTNKEADPCILTVRSEPFDMDPLMTGVYPSARLGRLSGSSGDSCDELRCSVPLAKISQPRTSSLQGPVTTRLGPATQVGAGWAKMARPLGFLDRCSASVQEQLPAAHTSCLDQTRVPSSFLTFPACPLTEDRQHTISLSVDPINPESDPTDPESDPPMTNSQIHSPDSQTRSPLCRELDGFSCDVDSSHPVSGPSCPELDTARAEEPESSKSTLIGQAQLSPEAVSCPASFVQKFGLPEHHLPLTVDEM